MSNRIFGPSIVDLETGYCTPKTNLACQVSVKFSPTLGWNLFHEAGSCLHATYLGTTKSKQERSSYVDKQ